MTVEQENPSDAFETLKTDTSSGLVDVRTAAEWTFVGLPDVSSTGKDVILKEWASYPHMGSNPNFITDLLEVTAEQNIRRLYFICRSGVRSLHAALAMTDAFTANGKDVACVNVSEGFEGDLNGSRHRGGENGWKARGLPWVQS